MGLGLEPFNCVAHDLLHNHPCPEVRAATLRLLDALATWNRNTGRENLVIIKDTIGVQLRTLSSAPLHSHVTDEAALEMFNLLEAKQRL